VSEKVCFALVAMPDMAEKMLANWELSPNWLSSTIVDSILSEEARAVTEMTIIIAQS